MPVTKYVSTDQPARYLALTAIMVSIVVGTLAYVGTSTAVHRSNRKMDDRIALLCAVVRLHDDSPLARRACPLP